MPLERCSISSAAFQAKFLLAWLALPSQSSVHFCICYPLGCCTLLDTNTVTPSPQLTHPYTPPHPPQTPFAALPSSYSTPPPQTPYHLTPRPFCSGALFRPQNAWGHLNMKMRGSAAQSGSIYFINRREPAHKQKQAKRRSLLTFLKQVSYFAPSFPSSSSSSSSCLSSASAWISNSSSFPARLLASPYPAHVAALHTRKAWTASLRPLLPFLFFVFLLFLLFQRQRRPRVHE